MKQWEKIRAVGVILIIGFLLIFSVIKNDITKRLHTEIDGYKYRLELKERSLEAMKVRNKQLEIKVQLLEHINQITPKG